MSSSEHRRRFFNYPVPLKGPAEPYKNNRKPNPPLRGWYLIISVVLLETFRFIREIIWANAGFGSLRKIRTSLEDYEPRWQPTVVPLPGTSASGQASRQAVPTPDGERPASTQAKFYSVADYRRMYLDGKVTPSDVAKALLPLIRRDTTPPGKHSLAWFDTKEDLVLKAADESTRRYRAKQSLGPLDGVPTAVKDEYDMEGYLTCLGSRNDYTPSVTEDGTITNWNVRKLEEAGAVVLGKLSMHEFGLDTTGNNPIYGTPPNPFNEKYYTGGSSSGSGYAVGTGLIPIALGSDGGGSIRIPSSWCSIYGLKPTHERLSFAPAHNHCNSAAVLGPMAADIRSLAALFEVVGAPHPSSAFPRMAPLQLHEPDIKQPKILGVPEAWFGRAHPEIRVLCRSFIEELVTKHGYTTVPIEIPFLTEGQTAHALVVLNDASTLLPETGNLTHANKILLALGRTTSANDYLLAQKLRQLLMQHLAYLWEQHPGMVIITPTTACAGWPIREQSELKHGVSDGDRTLESMEYVWLANFCGLPSLSVPAGYATPEGKASTDKVQKVPVGLMATGEWCTEEALLQFGLDAEKISEERRRRPPIWEDVIARAGGVA